MKPLKEKISITVDSDVVSALKEKAEYYDRSLSQLINIVLRDYLENLDVREDLKNKFTGR